MGRRFIIAYFAHVLHLKDQYYNSVVHNSIKYGNVSTVHTSSSTIGILIDKKKKGGETFLFFTLIFKRRNSIKPMICPHTHRFEGAILWHSVYQEAAN